MTTSFVEVLTLAPSEPGLTEKEIKPPLVRSGSADLETARSDDSTGKFPGDALLLDSTLDMAMECHMVHCEMTLHQLQGRSYSDYGWNKNDDTRMVWTSRKCDWGFRGRSSGLLLDPYPLFD